MPLRNAFTVIYDVVTKYFYSYLCWHFYYLFCLLPSYKFIACLTQTQVLLKRLPTTHKQEAQVRLITLQTKHVRPFAAT